MEVRKVSSKSQLTLPKEFAGKLVSMEMLAEGVIQIKTGEFVPDSERIFQKALQALSWLDMENLRFGLPLSFETTLQ